MCLNEYNVACTHILIAFVNAMKLKSLFCFCGCVYVNFTPVADLRLFFVYYRNTHTHTVANHSVLITNEHILNGRY